ncbi:SDR family oxidoreductase [Balneolaceae bacterium ANBcel3]|nr:SDR family oxidoreductase [Balneolaceae bacterium ANBcel3]
MFTKKMILVTGASRGIGYATSVSLAKKKERVLALARSSDALEKLQNEHSRRIHIQTCDLMNLASVQLLVDYIREHRIQLTGVVHNAGALINKPFSELTDDDWMHMWNANVMTAVRLVRAVLPFMTKKSHIVTIGSMGGFQGSAKFPGLLAYSTSKGALSTWTECMAKELEKENISVNCLCLGAVQTEMLNLAFPGLKAPLKPDDIAEFISDFVINGHRFMNGKILPVALSNP